MDQLYQFKRDRVFERGDDPLVVQRVGVQLPCRPHEHDFIEIVLTAGGSGLQETALRRLPMKRGTLTILRPGHWHAYHNCRKLFIYNCCFGAELLRRELSWLIDEPKLAWLLWGAGEEKGDFPPIFNLPSKSVDTLQKLLDSFSRMEHSSHGMKISQLSLFLSALACEIPASLSGDQGRMQPLVRKCIRLMETDIARPWTIVALARSCGWSPEYLIRLFKGAIGMTPYAYLGRCRAERASALLLHSSVPVAEIGEQVGWPEPCHFARRFKKHYGISATAYRARIGR